MYPLRFAVGDDVKVSALGDGMFVLRDLVGLRQVGVEVVFTVEARVVLMSQWRPSPIFTARSTAWSLMTGSVPGTARQIGETLVFGVAPM